MFVFFFKQKTAYDMRISDLEFRRVLFRSLLARPFDPLLSVAAVRQRLTEAHRPPGRAAEQLAVAHGDVAANHGHHRPAGHRLTLEGGPAALPLQPIGIDRPPGLQTDQRDVAVIPSGDAAFSGAVVEALGAGGSQLTHTLERPLAAVTLAAPPRQRTPHPRPALRPAP